MKKSHPSAKPSPCLFTRHETLGRTQPGGGTDVQPVEAVIHDKKQQHKKLTVIRVCGGRRWGQRYDFKRKKY